MTDQSAQQQTQFAIQRIYLKDFSFESPQAPQIFQSDWKPDMQMDIHTSSNVMEPNVYEVVLSLTVTVKSAGQAVAFVVEVKQAGIFVMEGFDDEQLKQLLGSYCPSIIYPYAREAITDIVTKGSFPQLVLAPINFDSLHAEQEKQQAQAQPEQAAEPANDQTD